MHQNIVYVSDIFPFPPHRLPLLLFRFVLFRFYLNASKEADFAKDVRPGGCKYDLAHPVKDYALLVEA